MTDLDRAVTFYEQAFGWKAVPADLHEVVILKTPQSCPYGISLVQRPEVKKRSLGGIVIYFKASHPEDIVEKTRAAGGKKRFGPRLLKGYGHIYQLEDPDGNRFGIFKPL